MTTEPFAIDIPQHVLNELHKGNKSVIPEKKFIDIPARVIDSSNVEAFAQESKSLLEKK